MIIQICVGSSCHLKGSEEMIEFLKESIKEYHLEEDITLAGSFCIGECNREGITLQVDDTVYTGITRDKFKEFFMDKVLKVIEDERK